MMEQSTVPDFFQEDTEDALRAQVEWLVREAGVDDAFFAKLLGTDEKAFSGWRQSEVPLPPGGEEPLRSLWGAVLHLLSFLNFDLAQLWNLFQKTMPACPSEPGSRLAPPWAGMSLKAYLEQTRTDGIDKLIGWVTGLRFGDPYAA